VVVVAAGWGVRVGKGTHGLPKQYRMVGGQTVLRHTLKCLSASELVEKIVVVVRPSFERELEDSIKGLDKVMATVVGAATRQTSVLAGLEYISSDPPDYVLIHDGVRPFVSGDTIERVVRSLSEHQSVFAAVPHVGSLKLVDACGRMAETVSRDAVFVAQTPQGFHFEAIIDAHRKAVESKIYDFADDAAVAMWAGIPTFAIKGNVDNFKITTVSDFLRAEGKLLLSRSLLDLDVRCGFGYDVHAFCPGNSLRLCGIEIPHNAGLDGHSDADVPLHALTDAILGTIGQGDIGEHFPTVDPRWRDQDSSFFVQHALKLLEDRGGNISNVDISIIAETPSMAPYKQLMCGRVAEILGLSITRVSVKATTNEGMGFIGRREGLAAVACVTVSFPNVVGQMGD